jgi:polysaccharide deacetylase 2 family uncharacterized protein YibQ
VKYHFRTRLRIILVLSGILLVCLITGAFWDSTYNPLHSSSTFSAEHATQLQRVIEAELAHFGVSYEAPRKTTVQQQNRSRATYEYHIPLADPALFADLVPALSDSVCAHGGQILQTYLQADTRQASVVIGIGERITHTLVMTWPPAPTPPPTATPAPAADGQPRVAIVIDDLGASEYVVHEFLALEADLTFSILPHLEKSTAIATFLHEQRQETLLHLPMQPEEYPAKLPGQGAILMQMDTAAIQQTIARNLQSVPYVVGVNNHMGSHLTTNSEKMRTVLQTLRQHNLFFLDSRTTADSVAYQTAQQLGVKTAQRKVFLDVEPHPEFVRRQLLELAALAEQGEPVIAIGHPKDATLQVLHEMLPEFRRRQIQIVRLSQLVR